MKKVFRFFAIAAFAFGMTAMVSCKDDPEENGGNGGNSNETGDPVLLDENFDNGMPSDWVNIDADGDSFSWKAGSDLMGNGNGHGGSNDLVLSQSYDNTAGKLEPDNYLVTKTIHIPGAGGYKLTFWVCAQDAAWAAEHYAVYAGHVENGSFVASGNALFEETIGSKEQSPWKQKTVNLDAYKGQDIQIAFRHYNCTDMFYLDLDDVKISNE